MSLDEKIAASEILGRAIFDSKKATQSAKGKIPPKVFRERDGVDSISVDRLTLADRSSLRGVHDTERHPQTLKGWACVSRTDACGMGRTVTGVRTNTNDWHAEITLPSRGGTVDIDEQDAHALNLAKHASFDAIKD